MPKISKVTRAGQITIPKSFRDEYCFEEGDVLEFIDVNGGILIKRLESAPPSKLSRQAIIKQANEQIKSHQYKIIDSSDEVADFINGL